MGEREGEGDGERDGERDGEGEGEREGNAVGGGDRMTGGRKWKEQNSLGGVGNTCEHWQEHKEVKSRTCIHRILRVRTVCIIFASTDLIEEKCSTTPSSARKQLWTAKYVDSSIIAT